jgi:putative flavoprotein involved in K+ transport
MRHIDTLVIGAGHVGLAMSRCLTDRGRDHVVLERGRSAERWRSERWDSLRLLTPNWMSRLPGWSYDGTDPDGYMSASEVVAYLDRYARSFGAPDEAETTVEAVERIGERFMVPTDQGTWRADHVVVATGHCDRPQVPAVATCLSPSVHQIAPSGYGNPAGCRKAASTSSGPPPPVSSSRTSWRARGGRSCSPWVATPGFPAATEAWTSGGGSSGWACSTRPS